MHVQSIYTSTPKQDTLYDILVFSFKNTINPDGSICYGLTGALSNEQ